MSVPTVAPSPTKPPRKAYVPAVGPRLRIVLYIVFGLVAALGANSLYLSAITFMDWWQGPGQTYQNYFYLYMFLAHLGLGLLLVIPYCLFGAVHLLAAQEAAQSDGGANRLRAVHCRHRRAGDGRAADARRRFAT